MLATKMALARPNRTLEVERDGDTLIITPRTKLSELAFQSLEAEANEILDLVTELSIKNIVVDFRRTAFLGIGVLEYCLRLWKRVKNQDGQIAFCNVSKHEMEILQCTRLDCLWTICRSRDQALEAVNA